MLKIKANNLVNSEEFVREPVAKEVNEILTSSSSKTILTGGKGIGKSTVLCSLEKKGLGCKEQTIYDNPEGIITLTKEPNEKFDNKVFDYLSELRFTNNILFYIKSNYPIAFKKHFEKDMESVHSLLDELFKQLNSSCFEDIAIECKYGIKELSFDILNRFRQIMGIDKLNIAIDRFDKMNGSSEYVQKTYERYFDMFDRVILTSDDPNLDKERLTSKGYDLRHISYGNDKDVLGEIIRHRKPLYEDNKTYKELFTTDLFLDKLINFNGNIDLSLEALGYIRELLSWYDGNNHSIENVLDEAIEEKKNYSKKLEKVISKPTLYL